MTGLETKFTQPGVALSDGSLIRGYASVFGVKDRGGDIVMPGAYSASLKRLTEQAAGCGCCGNTIRANRLASGMKLSRIRTDCGSGAVC